MSGLSHPITVATALVAALFCVGTASAQPLRIAGDGSGSNNPDLLLAPSTNCQHCLATAPHEWDAPPFTLDWSLGLRGSYVQSNGVGSFEALAVPSVSLRHDLLRGSYGFDATAELSRDSDADFRVNSLRIGAAGEFAVSQPLTLSGSAAFELTQPGADTSGYPSDTASASQEMTGTLSGSAAYDFGPVTATLGLSGARSVYGPTTLVDNSTIDNSANDNWRAGTDLRLGYKVTPLLTAFVEGGAAVQLYDIASPDYGLRLDAIDYAVKAGLAAEWGEVLSAEASVGLGLRQFSQVPVEDIVSTLYDATITFRPDETLTLRGGLATSIDAPGPNASAAAKVDYAATASAEYQLNPWLRLRASAGTSYALYSDSSETETGYELGAGADYLLNETMSLAGDYAYSLTSPSSGSADEDHRVTLGVTLRR